MRSKVGLVISLVCWATLFGIRYVTVLKVQIDDWVPYLTGLLPNIVLTFLVGWFSALLWLQWKAKREPARTYRVVTENE